jgi:hypothetical protein
VLYLAVLLVATLPMGHAPVLGTGLGLLPWYLRELALPTLLAGLLTMVRIEGRPFHLAARASMRLAFGSRHRSSLRSCPRRGERWLPPDLVVLPDGSDARFRRLLYKGPGSVLVRPAHELADWGSPAPSRGPLARHKLALAEMSGCRPPVCPHRVKVGPRARVRVG